MPGKRYGRDVPTVAVCCYPLSRGLVAAHARMVRQALDEAEGKPLRVLFSAHGLPETIIRGGDPYQWQVEQTAAAIIEAIGRHNLDWSVCYQSRVGPLAWIGPSAIEEIEKAGREGIGVVVVPVAFVSEHSETLVELDIEYRKLAQAAGCQPYIRVPVPGNRGELHRGPCGRLSDPPWQATARPLRRIVAEGSARQNSASVPARCRDMEGSLDNWYLTLKALHILAVIAWMAGMLYLPRLFVYHVDCEPGARQSETFKVMERRLLKGIINPAMIAAFAFGILLMITCGRQSSGQKAGGT